MNALSSPGSAIATTLSAILSAEHITLFISKASLMGSTHDIEEEAKNDIYTFAVSSSAPFLPCTQRGLHLLIIILGYPSLLFRIIPPS
jgi:hypothetical protein